MSNNNNSGFDYIKALGYIISVLTILGFIVNGFSSINAYAERMSKIERDYEVLSSETLKLTAKLDEINTKLVSLTVTLGRFEERLDVRTDNRR